MIARAVLWLFLHCCWEYIGFVTLQKNRRSWQVGCLQWWLNPTVTMVTKAFIKVVSLIHTLFSSRARKDFT